VLALHATDPATVYLSALSRCPTASYDDVAHALYEERSLVRLMAMRRTMFVVPAELVPVVHHAASLDVAVTMRRRLVKELTTGPTDPALPADVDGWLRGVEEEVERTVLELGTASGAQLAKAVAGLRTALLPRTDKKYDVRRAITSQVLVLMGTEGRLVRHRPLGTWTSRQHTWAAASTYWPDGIPEPAAPRVRLVEEYLRRFGPATEADVAWWTGWPLGTTRKAIAALDLVSTEAGLLLADDTEPVAQEPPRAALLPALDPTPMGWKERGWFLLEDSGPLYDRFGNVGPTVWWGGEVVGGWAVRPDGSVAVRLLADRGGAAAAAVEDERCRLEERLGGAAVVPTFPTPLERELRATSTA